MEQNMTATPAAATAPVEAPATPAMASKKQKSGTGLKFLTAFACLAAIGGIGFGVYEMMQNNQKDTQISDLKVQISNANSTTTTTPTETGTTVTITGVDKVGGPYIENGYFFVPKWGVKYKLSDSLTNYGYSVDQNSQGDSYGNYVVGLTALSKSDYVSQPQAAYFNDIFSCSVVTIRAMEDSKKDWWGSKTADVQFNGYNFVIHDTWRQEYCTSDYMASTDKVATQLKAILSNPEKI